MRLYDVNGIDKFLKDYPGMSIVPTRNSSLVLKGKFNFKATVKGGTSITDDYQLEITIPDSFPREVPKVIETGGKIPRRGEFHVNGDSTLCLGSPLRLLMKISENPTLGGFAKNCIIPYLYAVSFKLQHGGKFILSDLSHGTMGLFEDYVALFRLETWMQIKRVFILLGMKKRLANKTPCPCGCGNRLGKCSFNRIIRKYRKLAARAWFKRQIDLMKDL